MRKWIVFYNSTGKELLAYTERGTFAGEREATIDLLAYERGIPAQEIIIKEEDR